MFRVNRRIDYSVRVLLALAKRPVGMRLSTQEIQAEMLIPRPFLQRIIADLSKASLIQTYAGPSGGVELACSPQAVTLRAVWEIVEGPLLISECLVEPGECPLDTGCPVRLRWSRLQAMIAQELEATTLADLAREVQSQGLAATLMLEDCAI